MSNLGQFADTSQATQACCAPEEVFPVSFAQQRLWVLTQMEGSSEAYHIPLGLQLKGHLNPVALRRALDRIAERHEVLRTTFTSVDGMPMQRIAADGNGFALLEHDLRGYPNARAELASIIELEVSSPFDLATEPPIRGRLIRLSDDQHVVLITMHHIASDGWSSGVLSNELSALYTAFVRGKDDPLPELEIQYVDYSVWQREWVEGEILQRQAAYWKKTLAGAPPMLELPTDHPRPAKQGYAGAFSRLELDQELTTSLKELSRRNGVTLFMVLMSAWAAMLARISGQQDILIGTPTANRGRAEIENLIGFFVNTLVVRLDVSATPTVRDLLQQVKEQTLAAQQNQDIPFERVVEIAQPARSMAHSPLFQVLFSWQNAPEGAYSMPDIEVTLLPLTAKVAKFDLSLYLQEKDNTIIGGLEYATALFEESTIERYVGYFRKLLQSMAADDARPIDKLAMLSDAERRRLLHDWNDTRVDYASNARLHDLFAAQVSRSPHAEAVRFEDQKLNYTELDRRANQLAHYLTSLGVGPEALVGICLERSIDMVVGVLAVLKAGGAYVPLDPSFPRARLGHMVEDSHMAVLLTHRGLDKELELVPPVIVRMDTDWHEITKSSADPNGLPAARSDTRAYVLYTSGSTGKPKGVEISHRAIVNFLLSMQREPGFTANDTMLAVTTLSFDIAGLELYLPLITGGRVVVASREDTHDPALLMKLIEESNCTVMQATPATWRGLIQSGWMGSTHLKILCGGESMPRDLADDLLARCGELWNMYGPTETTVWSTIERVGPGVSSVSIGRPIANTQLYVLSDRGALAPQGTCGELYIGGDGLARGYLQREDLTRERFIPSFFAPGAKLYRTGDLARWLPNGKVECLGRVDNQVKIRGFRIELGEIEARLSEYPEVQEAAVIAREDTPGDKRVVAYYTTSGQEAISPETFRSHLSISLPEYMIPSAYVLLEAIPQTPNGKLDRKALLAADAGAFGTGEYEPPQNEVESALATAWEELLKVDRVGRRDNFFDLGGHSLLAVQLISRLRHVFPDNPLPLRALLEAPTVERLALWLHSEEGDDHRTLVLIRPGSSVRPPFFCVHASDGTALGMRPLAMALDADLRFYCLQAKGLDGSEPFDSVEEAAQSYLDEIRKVQPHGPYHLGGYCFGGAVAFEMARILEESGENVSTLMLIDSYNPEYFKFNASGEMGMRLLKFFIRKARHHSHRILTLPPSAWLRYAGGRFKAIFIHLARFITKLITGHELAIFSDPGKAPTEQPVGTTPEVILKRLKDVGPALSIKFVPKAYRGDAVVYRVNERNDYNPYEDSFLGWRPVVRGAMESYEIDATHENILRDPVVQHLGEKMNIKLRETAGATEKKAAPHSSSL